jgi:hypothetical protein
MNSLLKTQFFVILSFLMLASPMLQAQHIHTGFEPGEPHNYWQNTNPIEDTTAFGGKFYHRTIASQEYALGLEFPLPDSLNNTNLQIDFDAWLRFNVAPSRAIFVLSLTRNDSLLYWHGIKAVDVLDSTSVWKHLSASFKLPANYGEEAKLKSYLWNPDTEVFDIDDLTISMERLQMPTFMPDVHKEVATGLPQVLTQNTYYELLFFPETASLLLADNRGRHLTYPLVHYAEFESDGLRKEVVSGKWKLLRKREKNGQVKLHLRNRSPIGRIDLTISAFFNSPRIDFTVETRLKQGIRLFRNALQLPFYDEPSRIMRKNSLEDQEHFQHEYHLAKQGAIIGEGIRTIGLYHLQQLSSVQMDTDDKLLLLNMEYHLDQPMVHFPLRTDTTNFFEDQSARQTTKRAQTTNGFNFVLGAGVSNIPRFMPVPDGFEAAIIWTEHADWTNIRTHRAVNFGREDIADATEAIGGFVKYGIPVSKSVFYNNPDSITNTIASNGLFNELHATIQTDSAFFDFLKQLHARGHDICLHTPEQFSSSRENLKEALHFMHDHFKSPTWIDHGYNNKPWNNRENLVCDGLLAYSPQYARDLWQEFGVRYFWNPYLETLNPFDEWAFNGHFQLPYPGFGDRFPDGTITTHPAIPEAMLWGTTGTMEVPQERLWDYFFHPGRLANLINFRTVHINHVYPAWALEGKGFWRFDQYGKMIAPPGFNQALSRLAELRDARKILPTTIAKHLAYVEAISELEYNIIAQGHVEILNHGNQKITGLNLAVSSDSVEVNGEVPESKKVDGDTIFWFDLEAGETATIRYW